MKSVTAELWLQCWGENVRSRKAAAVGRGVGEGGRYRPEDDPHPSSWVMAQVETVLASLGPIERCMAHSVYVQGRSVWSLRHELGGHKAARCAQDRLHKAVHHAVVAMRERTIAEAHARQLIESGHFDTPAWQAIIAWLLEKDGHTYRVADSFAPRK